MGQIVIYECEKCWYSFHAFLGAGIAYHRVCAETVEKMKSGELGE